MEVPSWGRDPLQDVEVDGSVERQYATSLPLNARKFQYDLAIVQRRILLGNLDKAPLDAEERALETLQRLGMLGARTTLVDIGTGDGGFPAFARVGFNFKGRLIPIEPFVATSHNELSPVDSALLREAFLRMKVTDSNGSLIAAAYMARGDNKRRNPDDLDLSRQIHAKPYEIRPGTATDTGLPRHSVDVVTINRVLQHLSAEERLKAYAEARHILKDDGLLLITATGQHNKYWTRFFEGEIATELSLQIRRRLQAGEITPGVRTEAPPNMNTAFTTESARAELYKQFDFVYCSKIEYGMVIEDELSIRAVWNALRSRRDGFSPLPTLTDFDAAVEARVLPMIIGKVNDGQPYEDIAEHSIFICSNHELTNIPPYFMRVDSVAEPDSRSSRQR